MNRRKFLTWLGLAPIVAPAAIKAAAEVPAMPKVVINYETIYEPAAATMYGRSPCMDALPSLRELQDFVHAAQRAEFAELRDKWIKQVKDVSS